MSSEASMSTVIEIPTSHGVSFIGVTYHELGGISCLKVIIFLYLVVAECVPIVLWIPPVELSQLTNGAELVSFCCWCIYESFAGLSLSYCEVFQ